MIMSLHEEKPLTKFKYPFMIHVLKNLGLWETTQNKNYLLDNRE